MAEDPAAFHVGMSYLTGEKGPADTEVCWSEEDMISISSFVHIVREKSTLGKAKVWMDKQLCAGSIAYVRLGQVKKLLTAPCDVTELRTLIDTCIAGSSGGGLAVQAGLTYIDAYEAALLKAQERRDPARRTKMFPR